MPVVNMPSPLGAASDAIGGYVAQKNENIDRAEAKRQRDATLALERERLASQKYYQSQTLDLERKAQDEAHRHTLVAEGSQALHDKIAQAAADFEQQMRPVTIELAKAQLAAQQDANAQAPLKTALLKFQVQGAKVDAAIKSKYGPQEAEAAIQEGQARLKLIAAQVNETNAIAYRTMHPVNPGGIGGLKYADEKSEALRIKTTVQRVKANPAFQQLPPVIASHLIKDLEDGTPPDEVLLNARATIDPNTKQSLPPDVIANVAKALGVPMAAQPQEQQGGGFDVGGALKGIGHALTPFWNPK